MRLLDGKPSAAPTQLATISRATAKAITLGRRNARIRKS
jgi:hypothetical protein